MRARVRPARRSRADSRAVERVDHACRRRPRAQERRRDPPARARRIRSGRVVIDRLGGAGRSAARIDLRAYARRPQRRPDHGRAFWRHRNFRHRRRRRRDRGRDPQRSGRHRARQSGDRSLAGVERGFQTRGGCVSALIGLQCHLCKTTFAAEATYVCDRCLGPLEPVYDYGAIALTREQIERRPKNLWRYRELLPIAGEPRTGFNSGFTPLVRCHRLAERLGVRELYIKDDSVNHPTLSYKDRVVSVAATRAVELGFEVLACASTGNLANSVSAHAARLGLECCVFIPDNLEAGKLLGSAIFNPTILAIAGNYDDVNRLCTQVGDRYGWGFVNINLRSYYAEGAKTFGFEIVEQLGWRYPRHVVATVAGGSLFPSIMRGFRELRVSGLVSGELPRMYAAQAAGCAPVVRA